MLVVKRLQQDIAQPAGNMLVVKIKQGLTGIRGMAGISARKAGADSRDDARFVKRLQCEQCDLYGLLQTFTQGVAGQKQRG